MSTNWQSYVPHHVIEQLTRLAGDNPIGQVQRLQAVTLFADISGFTQISEALGKVGQAGTEELTIVLNSYFEPMIRRVHRYGGIIGKFGGDAMTILFPYTRQNQVAAVRRALQCALDMQSAMHHYKAIPTSAGQFSLAMKAGLALGSVLCTTVGDPTLRLEYIIAGRALDLCADAEHHAGRGEIVVHNNLLAYAGQVEVIEERDGFSCIAAIKPKARAKPLVPADRISLQWGSILARYLHPVIAHRVEAGQAGFVNEHRKVSVLFVSFSGIDYDHDPDVVTKLQNYLTAVIHTVHRYDGYLNKVDMGDKGSKYIILFGAPVIHENDEERALHCALELRALSPYPIRIGINTGFVYCGRVGSDTRQEYTVMGDPVNLSARLMQAAQTGQILVSGRTQRYAPQPFHWETLAPIKVKGKSQPISIFALQRRKKQPTANIHEPKYDLPLVGREQELQQAQTTLEHARQGHGQLLTITGEAGLGKSRLTAEIITRAETLGYSIYGGACQSHGTTTPYLVWRTIWQNLFEIDPAWPAPEQIKHLENRLTAIDPHLLPRLPLLGSVLNLSLPENAFTQTLDTELRRDLLQSLLLPCLSHHAQKTPLLLVLEDCHWFDGLSQALFEFIGRNISDLPLIIIAVCRPPDRRHDPLRWAKRLSHFSQIALGELTFAEAQHLIRLKIEQRFDLDEETPPELLHQITTKAQGNPFYIEELINYIHDRGLNPYDTTLLQSVDLPDSLHSLILSRIDQLEEAEKTTLKVASVIGRLFKASWVWGSYPALGSPAKIKHHLETLSRLDLIPLDKTEPELEYLFKHITTQEVAYNSLAFTLREHLHEAVGDFIERTYAETLNQYVDVLAHHYGRSRNTAKQRIYFRQAGDAAKSAYANDVALDYYRRLLPLLPETEKAHIMLQLGEVHQLVGQWPEAKTMYQQAFAVAQKMNNEQAQAHCQNALGQLLSYSHSYSEALTWLQEAHQKFEQRADATGLSRALEYISFVHVQQSHYDQALSCSRQQLDIATQQDDPIGVSTALKYMGHVYWVQGLHSPALHYLQQAIETAAAADFRRGEIQIGNDIAGLYWEQGDYEQSLHHLKQALIIAMEIGDLHTMGMITANAGEIYRLRGDYSDALDCYKQGLYVISEIGDRTIMLNILSNMADIYLAQNQGDEAAFFFELLIPARQAMNNPYYFCEDLYRYALLHHHRQDNIQAQSIMEHALAIAIKVERQDIRFLTELESIKLNVAFGQIDKASATNTLLKLLVDWPADSEQAALHNALWQLNQQETFRQTAANLYQNLYTQTPNIEYRRGYEALTGNTLPAPPPLPKLPEVAPRKSIALDKLLAKVAGLLEAIEEEKSLY
ncbi:MAG: tetratricopeptide repeat protein [Anaerolineae bacterium]|nr:tetratricopeptide repeat protein [Anaerolineae bacterium]